MVAVQWVSRLIQTRDRVMLSVPRERTSTWWSRLDTTRVQVPLMLRVIGVALEVITRDRSELFSGFLVKNLSLRGFIVMLIDHR